jgi:MFS family permease
MKNGAGQSTVVSLTLLTLAAASATFARTALSPLQEAVRTSLALTDTQMALIQGPALAAPVVLAAIPVGLLIDRCSRARLVFILVALAAAGSFWTAFASCLADLFAARCVIGLAAAAMAMTVSSLLADLLPAASRGRGFMVVGVGQVAGISAAFALGGSLLSIFGGDPAGWRATLEWLSVPVAVIALLTLNVREPPRAQVLIQKPSLKQAVRELLNYRRIVLPLLIGGAMVGIADVAATIWAIPALSRNLGLSPARLGATLATAFLVSGIIGPIVGGVMADFCQRHGGPRLTITVITALVLLSVPAAIFAIVPNVVMSTLLLILLITVGTVIGVILTTLTTIVIPNELRGLCFGVFATSNVIFGVGLSPLLVSAVSDAWGGAPMLGRALATVCAATSLIGAISLAFARAGFSKGAYFVPRTTHET